MSKYTTGEMAKLCDVSVRTVQYYDTKGILHPSDLTEGGRRLYSDGDLRKFQLICALKAIGLSLNSIKNVLESELSGNILTILLDGQAKLLSDEIDGRRKQLAMINAIKESIRDKAVVTVNTFLGIDGIMEKKKMARGRNKLAMVYAGAGAAAALGLSFMVWLAASRIWRGLAVYISVAIISLLISAFPLREAAFICPKCQSIFKPSLRRAFFSTGSNKVRWMVCPECGHKDWCVLQKQKRTKEAESNG